MGKVHADDLRPVTAINCDGEVSRSAAEVEDANFSLGEDAPKPLRRARAPEPVELQRQQMIQQVIPRRNLREHLAHLARGFRFRLRAFRSRALAGSGNFSHADVSTCVPEAYHNQNRRRNAARNAKRVRPHPEKHRHTWLLSRCAGSAQIANVRFAFSCPSPWLQPAASPAQPATAAKATACAP